MLIYCIEDINDLKYVGATRQKLYRRYSSHGNADSSCSSKRLNIHNSIIYVLEECEDKDRKDRERYWINKIDCVNECKLDSMDSDKIRARKFRWRNKPENREKERLYSENRRKK